MIVAPNLGLLSQDLELRIFIVQLIQKNMNLQILDCTLRDGGYYNSCDFGIELFNDYQQIKV